MAPRLLIALAVGAVACATVSGCNDAEPVSEPVSPSAYIDAVQALLGPPTQLASSISEQTGSDPAAAPGRDRLRGLVGSARRRLAEFRALRLDDAALRGQRDRLAAAYARLIPRMQGAADALSSGDRAGIARAARPFLDALRALSSASAPAQGPSG